jgi:hypothetical protein
VKSPSSLRQLLIGAFLVAALFYGGGFALNEYLRQRRGPWEVTFASRSNGVPTLVIRQPHLGIEAVQLEFPVESYTNPAATVRFDTPRQPLPVGEVKHDDLSYLPGVVTLEIYGHEIELMPRQLYVNRRSHAWSALGQSALTLSERPPALGEPKSRNQRRQRPPSSEQVPEPVVETTERGP